VSLERLARNQALFREANERLIELAEGFPAASTEFLCECSREQCTETIAVRPEAYEAVRKRATYFLIKSGHDIPEIETIVEEHDGFAIVEKLVARDFAAQTDPRARPRDA
jgi:hypothetical protein